jgi:hypothetical protein
MAVIFVRLAMKVIMKIAVILWMYSSYRETRHLIRVHTVLYIRNLVHVSIGKPLLLTEWLLGIGGKEKIILNALEEE